MTRLPALPTLPTLTRGLTGLRQKREEEFDLTEEERGSLLGKTLSGLAYVGLTVDKPAAAVRGVLSGLTDIAQGDPTPEWGGGLLNLIPFSDTAELTDPKERVWGQDILYDWGLTAKNVPGLNWRDPADLAGDVGGLAFEIVSDPFFWLTGPLGTFVKGGKAAQALVPRAVDYGGDVAKAAGGLVEGLKPGAPLLSPLTTTGRYTEQLRSGERGLFGLKMPFVGRTAVPITPEFMNKAAATAIDYLAEMAPGRAWRGLFSKASGAKALKPAEFKRDVLYLREGSYQYANDQLAGVLDLFGTVGPAFKGVDDLVKDIAERAGAAGNPAAASEMMRILAETEKAMPSPAAVRNALEKVLQLPPNAPALQLVPQINELTAAASNHIEGLRTVGNYMTGEYLDLGGKGSLLVDEFVEYAPRSMSPELLRNIERATGGMGVRQFMRRRAELLRDVPGGTQKLQEITTDALLTATRATAKTPAAKAALRAAIVAELAGKNVALKPNLGLRQIQGAYLWKSIDDDLRLLAPTMGGDVWYQAEKAKWLAKSVKATSKGGVSKVTEGASRLEQTVNYLNRLPEATLKAGLFSRDFVNDWAVTLKSVATRTGDLLSLHNFVKTRAGLEVGGAGVPLSAAWARGGYTKKGVRRFVRENPQLFANPAAHAATLIAAGADEAAIKAANKAADKFAKTLTVSSEAADAIRAFGTITEPRNIGAIGNFLDKVRASYAGYFTVPAPAFHARNWPSSLFQQVTDGRLSFIENLSSRTAAIATSKGKGTAEHLRLAQEGVDAGLLGHGRFLDIAEEFGSAGTPGGFFRGLGEAFQRGTWHPLKIRGVQEPTEAMLKAGTRPAQFKALEAGEHVYNWVEYNNRIGYYIGLRKKGYSIAQAKYWVERSDFHYGQLSHFEKTVARRGFLFWTWFRKNLPYQIQKLLERPGGRAAQTYRAFMQTQRAEPGEEGYVPSFLRETLGVRTGGTEQAAHFLRQSGLPIEDLSRFVFRGNIPDVKRTAGRFLAQTNPFAVWAYQKVSGQDPYSGRDVKVLRSPTVAFQKAMGYPERPIGPLDALLNKSPASRFVWDVLGMADTRKSFPLRLANLLTGVKTATYDVEKWQILDLQKALKEMATEDPLLREGTFVYMPKKYREGKEIPETQRKKLRQITAINQELKKLLAQREEQGR